MPTPALGKGPRSLSMAYLMATDKHPPLLSVSTALQDWSFPALEL